MPRLRVVQYSLCAISILLFLVSHHVLAEGMAAGNNRHHNKKIRQVATQTLRKYKMNPGVAADVVDQVHAVAGHLKDATGNIPDDVLKEEIERIVEMEFDSNAASRGDDVKHLNNGKFKGRMKGKMRKIGGRVIKGAGKFFVVLAVWSWASDANAHGVCYAVKHNAPIISYWYDGIEEIEQEAAELNELNESIANMDVAHCYFTAGVQTKHALSYAMENADCLRIGGMPAIKSGGADAIGDAAEEFYQMIYSKTLLHLHNRITTEEWGRARDEGRDKLKAVVESVTMKELPCCTGHCCDCNTCTEGNDCGDYFDGSCESCAACTGPDCEQGTCTHCDDHECWHRFAN